jgi:two-component system chemotaxis response regulator CheY
MRRIIARTLTGAGHTVTEAGDGLEALAAIEDAHTRGDLPQVALIDWNMPVMDGITFVAAAASRPAYASVVLVMVTTESEPDQIVRALNAGASEYVIKPFTPEALLDKLDLIGFSSPEPQIGADL